MNYPYGNMNMNSYSQYPNFGGGYNPPVPDQLSQLRMQNAFNQMNQPVQQQPTNPDERIWVQGEGAAQAYLVAPNGFVRLWDSTAPVFYEKRADQTGKPYMEVFEYTRKGAQAPNPESKRTDADNVIEKQLKSLEERVGVLEKRGAIANDAADSE